MRSRGMKKHRKKTHNLKLMVAGFITALVAFALVFWFQPNTGSGQAGSSLPTVVGGQDTPTTVAGESGPYEGLVAPDTTFRTVDGVNLKLSDLRGKYVVLWFMAAWCPSCTTVGQTIKDHLQTIRGDDRVKVIVVDLWTEAVLRWAGVYGRRDVPPPEDANTLKSFLTRWGDPSWYTVLDNDGELVKLWRIAYVDTTLVIDPDGVVRLRRDGPVTHAVLAATLPPL